ncbi:MAG: glutathione S-transferase family protein [Pseudomonadota bacterium]|nr:glutathione S-transferase family protein [Pseudomonadota bacterium]
MIRLYHCRNARSFRVLWALEELGLNYELILLPFPPRAFAKAYFAVNLLGTVPTMQHGPLTMTESAAICHYLAVRAESPLAVAAGDCDFGPFLQWTHFGEATLTFPQTLVLRYGLLEPEARRSPQIVDDYRRWFVGRLRAIEAALADYAFLCARRFTVADISVGYALLLAETLGIEEAFTPNVARYWQTLRHREGFTRATAAQDQATETSTDVWLPA